MFSLFSRKNVSKKLEPAPKWEGKCCCCSKRVVNYDRIPEQPNNQICIGCSAGWTLEGKARIQKLEQQKQDRHQIEPIKQALKELEEEKLSLS